MRGEPVAAKGCGPDGATGGEPVVVTGGEPVDALRGEFDVALEGEHVASTKNEGGAAATRGKYVTPATRGGDVNITENEAVAAVRSEDVAVMDMIPWQACKPR